MKAMRSYLNQSVELSITGSKKPIRGVLVEIGGDLLVLSSGARRIYVPLLHLQRMSLASPQTIPHSLSDDTAEYAGDLSYRKLLMNARGMFSELGIADEQSIHGYVTSILNDYFIFQSPAYHSVIVAMRHLKYMIPYAPNTTPYALSPHAFPVSPQSVSLARTLDQQLKKLEGQFVILDLGESPGKIGLLKTVETPILELITSDGASIFLHTDHVKTVHLP